MPKPLNANEEIIPHTSIRGLKKSHYDYLSDEAHRQNRQRSRTEPKVSIGKILNELLDKAITKKGKGV